MNTRASHASAGPHAGAPRYTAFAGHQRLASGALHEAARAVARAAARDAAGPLLIFDDATGQVVDVDPRGTEADVAPPPDAPPPDALPPDVAPSDVAPRRPGRPRLGVVAREVTLLPQHWAWLAAQPGGASVTLRRLVEQARRAGAAHDRARRARDAAYRFTHAVAGDLPGFEEATRALFAGDLARFRTLMAPWPADVRAYAAALASAEPPDPEGG